MTAFRDVAYAFRTFRQAPLASLAIVTTVGLGLGLVAAVFTFLSTFLFRVDEVPRVRELFAIERPRTAEGIKVGLPRPSYEALRRETSAFTDVFAMLPEIDTRVDGRTWAASLVTGNFFTVLGVDAALGRPLSPADDTPGGGPPVLVLSHRGWSRLFANDPAVIGRTAQLNGVPYHVVGVMPEGFRGLMVGPPDYWAPLSQLRQLQPALGDREGEIELDVVGRLRPGTSRQAAQAQLIAWDSRRAEGGPDARRSPGIILVPRWGTVPQPMEAVAVFTPLLFAFGLILLIGCANVASLLLARAVSRQREIGIRLSLGASRRRLIQQLLTESLILALAAAALGYGISRLVLETTIYALVTTMPPDIGDVRLLTPAGDWRVAVFLGAAAILSSALFGLAPAVQASRLELVRIIRGEVVRDARPGRARNVLIGLQVTASALLLICAGVFLRSALASSTVDPGMRTSDTVIIRIDNEPLRRPLVDAVRREPLIAAMAASWPAPANGSRPAQAESGNEKSKAAYKFVSSEYFSVLDIDVVRGRPFTPAETSARAAVTIVTESLARQLWPSGEALGQAIRLSADGTPTERDRVQPLHTGSYTVVGVARDIEGFRFGEAAEPNVYVPISAADAGTALTVRVHGDSESARQVLIQRLTAIDPALGDIVTMKTIAGLLTYFLNVGFWLTVVLGALALVLTLSGLYSVLSYLVEQRRKEIGVRMALGATAADVGALVLAETVRPVGFGLLAGAGVAGALAIGLLASPAAEALGGYVRVLDPIAYAAAVAAISVACLAAALIPTLQAARIEPINTLRQE